MKISKIGIYALSVVMLVSSCGTVQNLNNTTKGGVIGGTSGAAIGALLGNLTAPKHGNKTSRTLFGTAIGAAVGTGAGLLIGKKMDKAKAAAQQVQNAKVEQVTDANGYEAVKMTFDSGILFATGKSNLTPAAKTSLSQFVNNVLIPYPDVDVAIYGHTDNQGFRGVTDPAVNAQKNRDLSLQRATEVTRYLLENGMAQTQIKYVEGLGQDQPVADNSTEYGKQQNRRVEVFLYPSESMIKAAEAGTLQ